MKNRFWFSLMEKLPFIKIFRNKKQKKELENCVRDQAALTNELNYRLVCLQLDLRSIQDILWVDSVSVVDFVYPAKKNPFRQLMDKVMRFITNKKF